MGIRVGDQFARDGRGCERRSLVIEYGSLVVMRNPSSRYLKRFFEKYYILKLHRPRKMVYS